MKSYRKLLTQVFVLVWLGMTCGHSTDYDPVNGDGKNKISCCAKYGPAVAAVASSVADLVCCAGALIPSEDDTERSMILQPIIGQNEEKLFVVDKNYSQTELVKDTSKWSVF